MDGLIVLLVIVALLFSLIFLPLRVAAYVSDSAKGDGASGTALLAGLATFCIVLYLWYLLISSADVSGPWGVGPT